MNVEVTVTAARNFDMKYPSSKPCWLVWVITKSNQIVLRAVCTTESLANLYVESVKRETAFDHAKIESSKLDHLYCGFVDEQLLRERAQRSLIAKYAGKSRRAI